MVFRKNRYNWIFWLIFLWYGDDLYCLNVVIKYYNRYKNIFNMCLEFKISLICIVERYIVLIFICKSVGFNLERVLFLSLYLWWFLNYVIMNKLGFDSCMYVEWLYIFGSWWVCYII